MASLQPNSYHQQLTRNRTNGNRLGKAGLAIVVALMMSLILLT